MRPESLALELCILRVFMALGSFRMQPLSHPTASLDSRESEVKRTELCPAHTESAFQSLSWTPAPQTAQARQAWVQGLMGPACGAQGNAFSCPLLVTGLWPKLGSVPSCPFHFSAAGESAGAR